MGFARSGATLKRPPGGGENGKKRNRCRKPSHAKYVTKGMSLVNKQRRLKHHIAQQPKDECAQRAWTKVGFRD